jgi:hypothetical protein
MMSLTVFTPVLGVKTQNVKINSTQLQSTINIKPGVSYWGAGDLACQRDNVYQYFYPSSERAASSANLLRSHGHPL